MKSEHNEIMNNDSTSTCNYEHKTVHISMKNVELEMYSFNNKRFIGRFFRIIVFCLIYWRYLNLQIANCCRHRTNVHFPCAMHMYHVVLSNLKISRASQLRKVLFYTRSCILSVENANRSSSLREIFSAIKNRAKGSASTIHSVSKCGNLLHKNCYKSAVLNFKWSWMCRKSNQWVKVCQTSDIKSAFYSTFH